MLDSVTRYNKHNLVTEHNNITHHKGESFVPQSAPGKARVMWAIPAPVTPPPSRIRKPDAMNDRDDHHLPPSLIVTQGSLLWLLTLARTNNDKQRSNPKATNKDK